ncbi:MAG: sensor domain-containing diguanylate cyclase [Anaerolineales bacterium]|jgi:diguanylate cyclase (GGDEF)-like protein
MNSSQIDKLKSLHEIGHAITGETDLDILLPMIVQSASSITGSEESTLYLFDETTQTLYARAQKTETSELPKILKIKTSDSVIADVFNTGTPMRLAAEEIKIATGLMGTAMLAVPLTLFGVKLGVLAVYNWHKGDSFDQSDEYFLSSVSTYAAIAIRNSRVIQEKEELAMHDALTLLPNRRSFDQTLPLEIGRAKRHNYQLGLAILDVDGFKEYNDQLGHIAGDERLRNLGAKVKEAIRASDIAFRIGGDEFAIIFPGVDEPTLHKLVERLREAILVEAPFSPPSGIPAAGYSVSIGTSMFLDGDDPIVDFLRRADNSLLQAKKDGGNRVISYSKHSDADE